MLVNVARKRFGAATELQVLSGRGHFCAPSRRLRPYFGCSFQPEASLSGVQRQKVCGAGAVNTLLPFEQLDVGTNFKQWWRSELDRLSVGADTRLLSGR